MTHRALIEQMLAFIEKTAQFCPIKFDKEGLEIFAAAREYLAAPEVEPVGFFYFDDGQWKQAHDPISFPTCTKLFTHPAPEAKQPVNQQLLAELKDMGARYGLTSPGRAAIAAAEQAQGTKQ